MRISKPCGVVCKSDERDSRRAPLIQSIKDHLFLLFGLLGIMWVTALLDLLPFLHLYRYGIRPRSSAGLIGIVFAPFLHDGFGHFALNTIPFVVLGGIVLLGGVRMFWNVTVFRDRSWRSGRLAIRRHIRQSHWSQRAHF